MKRLRRLERWLWTGPVGHFVGVGIDSAEAYLRYRRARRRGDSARDDR
jgi:hypothetical protein